MQKEINEMIVKITTPNSVNVRFASKFWVLSSAICFLGLRLMGVDDTIMPSRGADQIRTGISGV